MTQLFLDELVLAVAIFAALIEHENAITTQLPVDLSSIYSSNFWLRFCVITQKVTEPHRYVKAVRFRRGWATAAPPGRDNNPLHSTA